MKSKTKATREIQQYLSDIQEHIKHFVNKDNDIWTIQASDNIMSIVEKYYQEKKVIK